MLIGPHLLKCTPFARMLALEACGTHLSLQLPDALPFQHSNLQAHATMRRRQCASRSITGLHGPLIATAVTRAALGSLVVLTLLDGSSTTRGPPTSPLISSATSTAATSKHPPTNAQNRQSL